MLALLQDHESAIRIIESIPGMSTLSVIYIVAEIGTNLSAFQTSSHLAAWAATKTRNSRLSIWYWGNKARLGDKKAITAVARELLCYICVMLKNGTLYDKSLDDAYVNKNRAIKLDGAHKIIGSRKKDVPAVGISENNEAAQLGHSQAMAEEKEKWMTKQGQKGIQSPTKTEVPKKRGRPRKSVE